MLVSNKKKHITHIPSFSMVYKIESTTMSVWYMRFTCSFDGNATLFIWIQWINQFELHSKISFRERNYNWQREMSTNDKSSITCIYLNWTAFYLLSVKRKWKQQPKHWVYLRLNYPYETIQSKWYFFKFIFFLLETTSITSFYKTIPT